VSDIGVAVAGAGVVGAMRAQILARRRGVRLCGVADVDLVRARAVAGPSGAPAVDDYRRFLDDPAVNALIVSSPVHLHEDMAVAAFEAGKHVLVEKPLANSVDACLRIVEAARAARRVLGVGFNHRYYPCFRVLKEIVDAGTLGPVDHVRAFGGHEGMTQFRAPWMYERATLGGGAMMDVGIHVADLVRYLGFEPASVTAVLTNGVWQIPGAEDNAMLLARSAGGVPLVYQATWSEWKGYRLRVEVYGRDGMALAHYPPLLNMIVRRGQAGRRARTWKLHARINVRERLLGWERTASDAFDAELTDFLGLLSGASGSCAVGVDGLRAVQFAAAAERSAASGSAVPIDA
jgi:UDP-N-acetylglucosamine 3-dehydrogenase